MYHRITENGEGEPSDYVINVNVFERQLSYFQKHGYYTPSLADVLRREGSHAHGNKPLLITFDDGYLDTLEIAAPLLKRYGFLAIVFIIPNFGLTTNAWDAAKGIPEARLMDKNQVLDLRAMGIEIGVHTLSHPSLPRLGEDELKRELRDCKKAAEDLLREAIISIAYPYGDVDERVMAATQEAGYLCAFATNSGPMFFHDALFRIRRTIISSSSNGLYLLLKVSGVEKACRIGWSSVKKSVCFILPQRESHTGVP
jgi:peptidoglycan/xylan/chitin deacetylase (PgdA/CDA1 family)